MAFDRQKYLEFIASKKIGSESFGFQAHDLPGRLFEHQRRAVEFACEKGRSALFLDTGLGKSGCEAVFADLCREKTNKPALILTPLAVAKQMQRECEAFGVEARVVREQEDVWHGINIANYERLSKLDPHRFGCVVLDESSILKSFTGTTKRALCELFKETPYRMAATATPAPNDHMEIGQHSEFLGVMPGTEMLSRWFITDQDGMGKYRLKGHAERNFWEWVASWARAASLPSDMGGDDEGVILPPLKQETHTVSADLSVDTGGALFRLPDNSATSIHAEKRLTIEERCGMAAEIAKQAEGSVIVWCERDDESAWLSKNIADCIEVKGSMPADKKERALEAFTFGERRVVVTKPKLAGFGLNWQHAATQVFASISHSYEQYYQAIRRSWRYGQDNQVRVHVVVSDTELPMLANVQRKAMDHDRMKKAMAAAMKRAQSSSSLKVAYERPPEIGLPEFMKGARNAA
jgi:superfamily II DNA or RNA helicase